MQGVDDDHGAEHRDDGEVGEGGPGGSVLVELMLGLHFLTSGSAADLEISSQNIFQRQSRAFSLDDIQHSGNIDKH